MFSALAPVLYVRVSPDKLSVRNIKTGEEIAEVPEMAISWSSKKAVIVGVGTEARKAAAEQNVKVVNPFNHPRTLIGDFTVAERLLKEFVRRLHGGTRLRLAPRIVVHPLGSPAGGFTQVECRAFRELALGAGASDVLLWIGRELTDAEVVSEEVRRSADPPK